MRLIHVSNRDRLALICEVHGTSKYAEDQNFKKIFHLRRSVITYEWNADNAMVSYDSNDSHSFLYSLAR